MTYHLVCSAFRMGMIPMDIPASEARYLYEKNQMNPPEKDAEYRKAARRESLEK